ncbi:hypothetical protein CB0940_09178 [Cercospora beticola]|uniref:PH domain-like protein n=1 Tax=Cercospora beticola TaxID=122368 RepID=A0A2G5HH71_CERBT|nr:hypothetical protein CB0940_09178 [Cercospora beticola]PIA91890.1 hypothetical protein CB0940_09178 [Cercospora beticola]WPB06532.1 hypothetical protein RHO25_011189 [Cercospora beticola]
MAPNRKKSRQQQQPAIASDYESDTAAFTDTQPFIPAPPLRTNDELNLLVLRRWQPEITSILTIAPFAVLYIFNPNLETPTWEKCEVQGSLFLCSLTKSPSGHSRYKVIILNRKGLENWEYEVKTEEAIQLSEEYVIVQKEDESTGEEQIYGIWIFEEKGGNTRDVVGNAILSCAREVEAMAEQEDLEEAYEDQVTYEEQQYLDQQGNGLHAAQQQWQGEDTPTFTHQDPHQYQQPQHQHQQIYETHKPQQQAQQQAQQPQGQSIDLATLFGKPAAAAAPAPVLQPPPTEVNIGGTVFTSNPFAEERFAAATSTASHNNAASRFPSSADTNFFRDAGSPARVQPQYQNQQQPQATAQQNTLLDLFKNAKRA